MKNSQKLFSILCHQKKLFSFVCVCIKQENSEAKRLTKERKIAAKIYSKNKTHTICLQKNY